MDISGIFGEEAGQGRGNDQWRPTGKCPAVVSFQEKLMGAGAHSTLCCVYSELGQAECKGSVLRRGA